MATIVSAPTDERYSRQALAGWRQSLLRNACVMVVGAGALGNEVLKNLALLGVGSIDTVDFDRVELSNLSRCVLFRDSDLHARKADAAAMRLREMAPDVSVCALPLDIRYDIGAGTLRDYDLVLGCVDNLEARLALGRLCRAVGALYLDGGMDATGGQVSLFHPHDGACFECGMTASMWARVHDRQSCLKMGAGETVAPPPSAATAIMASAIGALQAQEAVRWLLRATEEAPAPLQPGQKLCLQSDPYGLFVLQSSVSPECEAHAQEEVTERFRGDPAEVPVIALLDAFGADALHLAWDVVWALDCMDCGIERCVVPAYNITRELLACPHCERLRLPEMQSVITPNDPLAHCTLEQLGVPPRAVLDLSRAIGAENEGIRVELA